ncbi:MAG: lysophospholipase L2 [Firmicutes bacterium ADurb.Bin300]|nr:MAG: lysophospholipase L2 [Firmicutes bacterium ADurb.Bin300]HOD01703.1 alpha/beta hydrolase [Clostridiales bacterium]
MKALIKEFTFESLGGLGEIYARSFFPKNGDEAKAIIQITHGMAEHTDRYLDFAHYLCSLGYAVYMHDHLGHGKSVSSDEQLGFFGEKEGCKTLVEDVKQLTDIIKNENPDKKIILFGHSMGSFIARSYCEKYGKEIDGVIFCGTSGPNPGASVGKAIANYIAKRNGSHFRSEFINSLAFSSYNKKIKPQRTPFDWLTRDDNIVDKYIEDPKCGFLFTASGYRDLFDILISVSKRTWYANVPYVLPILLIAGESDPVGTYGKGVKEVARLLRDTNHNEVTLKLYPDCRHEILNELNKDEVFSDIVQWIDTVLSK